MGNHPPLLFLEREGPGHPPALDLRQVVNAIFHVVHGTYSGRLVEWVWAELGALLEVTPRPSWQEGLQVLPRRWVVERTLGWFNRYRRLSKVSVWLKAVRP